MSNEPASWNDTQALRDFAGLCAMIEKKRFVHIFGEKLLGTGIPMVLGMFLVAVTERIHFPYVLAGGVAVGVLLSALEQWSSQ